MKTKELLIKAVLPFIIIVVGFVAMKKMQAGRILPQKTIIKDKGALVEVFKVKPQDKQIQITGSGTITAREEIVITPQASGLVTKMHPKFQNGGFFKKGEMLFEIEEVDYKLAMENAKAVLAKAEFELVTIEGKAKVARMEWDRLHHADGEKPGDLLLYKPQLRNAEAVLAAAKANVKQAALNLARTKIYAPFNCFVRSEQVDVGQFVRSGNGVATISGTDAVEIIVPVRLEDLQWLKIPHGDDNKPGSDVTVSLTVGDHLVSRQGTLVRKLAEVDPKGRMARVVVSVQDPFNLQNDNNLQFPLSLGLFVNVVFDGRVLEKTIVIPRSILRDNGNVWLMDDNNMLRMQKITLSRQDRMETIITHGLREGDLIVKTNLTGAADGMKLRSIDQEEK